MNKMRPKKDPSKPHSSEKNKVEKLGRGLVRMLTQKEKVE